MLHFTKSEIWGRLVVMFRLVRVLLRLAALLLGRLYPLGVRSFLVVPVIVIMQRIPFYWENDDSFMIAGIIACTLNYSTLNSENRLEMTVFKESTSIVVVKFQSETTALITLNFSKFT